MDGIMGMEGPGPGQGIPIRMELLLGSSNPVALDIIATTIAGYDPLIIPTNAIAINRGTWLKDPGDIIYLGPDIASVTKKDFRRIPTSGGKNSLRRFIINRLNKIRRIQRRPVFIHENCIGCRECIKMCPQNAIVMHPVKENWVVLTDKKCIRCFCCSEVCQSSAVQIRRKLFGS
jgi:ferredoxin